MYAIIEVGGKQELVNKGQTLLVEKLENADGAELVLDKVLLVADGEKVSVGQPYVKGAKVKIAVVAQTKGPKLVSFKYRRRKSSHTKRGHRQKLTRIEIKDISL
jgi:large subunit ribosomal protein L21